MKKLNQFESLVIHDYEEAVFHLPDHSHTYYEMVYIVKGQGDYRVNQYQMPYKPADFFIVAPGDAHYFDIQKSTHFVFIKFTESYFKSNQHLMPDEYAINTPQAIMNLRIFREGPIRFAEPHKTLLKNAINSIAAYNKLESVSGSPAVFHLVLCILSLLKENIPVQIKEEAGQPAGVQDIIPFIHQNIYTPEKLQVKKIAAQLHIAPSYFGSFFKRNFHISYRQYINNLKIVLLKKRILTGKKSLKEIAAEFGFSDESHFSKYVKKHVKVNPSMLKKEAEATREES